MIFFTHLLSLELQAPIDVFGPNVIKANDSSISTTNQEKGAGKVAMESSEGEGADSNSDGSSSDDDLTSAVVVKK